MPTHQLVAKGNEELLFNTLGHDIGLHVHRRAKGDLDTISIGINLDIVLEVVVLGDNMACTGSEIRTTSDRNAALIVFLDRGVNHRAGVVSDVKAHSHVLDQTSDP